MSTVVQRRSNNGSTPLHFPNLLLEISATPDVTSSSHLDIPIWTPPSLGRFRFPGSRILQFRAEFFNIFNHPNFDPPKVTADSAAFASISSAEAPRQIQLALRVSF